MCHPQMQRKVKPLADRPVGVDHNHRIGALGRQHDVVKIVALENAKIVRQLVDHEADQVPLPIFSQTPLLGSANVTVPPGIGSGQQIRLRGMGLPPVDARSRKGDQLLTVQIHLPRRLSRKQFELLEQVEDGFELRRDLWD